MNDSRNWFVLALIVGIGWLLYLLAPVITPFVLSAGLAFLGDPLVDRLQRIKFIKWRCNRTVAVLIVFVLISAALVLVFLIFLPLLRAQIERLVVKAPEIFEWMVGTAMPWLQVKLGLESFVLDAESVTGAIKAYWKEATTAIVGMVGTVSRGGQAVMTWLMHLVLVPVVTFYLLRDWDQLVEGVRTLIPRKIEPVVSELSREIDRVLGAFIRGQLMVMLALGLIYSAGLWAVGLDLALIIGMAAGLLSIVPYLGTLVGVVAALVAAIFQFQDVLHPLFVLIVFGAGQSLEGMVLTPKLVGDRVGLHPVAVIFAVLAGGQLFGFLGILLALPVAAALNVLVAHLHQHYRESNIYLKETGGPEEH
ncbi:MAG: AI-2E family transporter [Xanthomonadales bacterium]|nr:AI-2E family transporter [Gammaproteobacteria bacterium]NND56709.1 AI-2E family transporter [Xanthomonadales bacterium]NNK52694.1 AI-2E family transporter [Xanthomonadales bacterium]